VEGRRAQVLNMMLERQLPEGMRYDDNYLTEEEEAALVESIRSVEFSTYELRGVVARRRVAFFGTAYDASRPATALPDFLLALRPRLAAWAGVVPEAFAMALINEYRPGSPIGWHRDAPQYDIVAGLSLLSSCRMRLRPYVSPTSLVTTPRRPRRATHEVVLAPRSCYLLGGEARTGYEHSIPAVADLRYSITFRTLRRGSHSPP
jgi:alkylated DNA repair dioxygenase AlkB